MMYFAKLQAYLAVVLLTASCLAVCAQESPSSEKMDTGPKPDTASLEAAQALAGAMFSPDIRVAMIESMRTIETTHPPGLQGQTSQPQPSDRLTAFLEKAQETAAPVYARKLTPDEMQQITQFLNSPVKRKARIQGLKLSVDAVRLCTGNYDAVEAKEGLKGDIDPQMLEAARQLAKIDEVQLGGEFGICFFEAKAVLYANALTADEIQNVVDFQRSPLGQRFDAVNREAFDKSPS